MSIKGFSTLFKKSKKNKKEKEQISELHISTSSFDNPKELLQVLFYLIEEQQSDEAIKILKSDKSSFG